MAKSRRNPRTGRLRRQVARYTTRAKRARALYTKDVNAVVRNICRIKQNQTMFFLMAMMLTMLNDEIDDVI